MAEQSKSGGFGPAVRAQRLEKGLGLRELARQVGMSATYLSKVEREEFKPPAEDKVRAIAQILGEDPDRLLALAGRVASDLPQIIRTNPEGMASFLRAARGLSPADMRQLTDAARQLKRKE